MVGIKMSFVLSITATMLHIAVNAGLCYANDRSVHKTAFLLSASGIKRRQYDFTSLRVHHAVHTSRRRAKFHGGGLTWLLAREGGYGEEWRKPSDTCPSAGTLRNFMLQRAIQTKLYHLNQVRNEPTYEFLQNFLDHQHLQIVRVTDYDFKTLFHGTTGLKVDWEARVFHKRLFIVTEDMLTLIILAGMSRECSSSMNKYVKLVLNSAGIPCTTECHSNQGGDSALH